MYIFGTEKWALDVEMHGNRTEFSPILPFAYTLFKNVHPGEH
jgi:hypothetical protein